MAVTKISVGAALLNLAAASLYGESNLNHTCQIETPYYSCSANAMPGLVDTCCTETFGGLVLSTQYWNTYTGLESQGQLLPNNTWTLHGLWPDFCNGSYTQYCDLSGHYDPQPSPNTTNGLPNGTVIPPYTGPPVSTFLTDFGKYDLLAWMNTFWINQGAPNWYFWAHEFSKHATCYSTFDKPCYGPQYVNHSDVIDFWETAISYYERLPTAEWLAEAGIVPSNTTSYTLSEIQSALTKKWGAIPYLGCSGSKYNATKAGNGTEDSGRIMLDEVWYYMHVLGKPQSMTYQVVNATSPQTTCATSEGAVWYYEMTPSSINPNPYKGSPAVIGL